MCGSVHTMSRMTSTGLRTLALLLAGTLSGACSGKSPGPTFLRSLPLIVPLSGRCDCTSFLLLGCFIVLDGGQHQVAPLVLFCCAAVGTGVYFRCFVIEGGLVLALSSTSCPHNWCFSGLAGLALFMLLSHYSQWWLCLNSAWVWCAAC